MIPKSLVEEVKQKTDIEALVREYVPLNQVLNQLKGTCPFCHSPTFTISKAKQIYKCFKCQSGGGVITFIQVKEKKTFTETIQFLANRLKMEIPNSGGNTPTEI